MTRPLAIVRVSRADRSDLTVWATAYAYPEMRPLHVTGFFPLSKDSLARRAAAAWCQANGFEVVREPSPFDQEAHDARAREEGLWPMRYNQEAGE